ncbi:hypothetical protein PsorP6_006009 [Peronosclerospora sorghi]|uniref:Uncharacterized protein n=1 Tax=Peronosclerospora sorghi TaxID=230839 RepID=A0ACC0W5W3_9STRA|nr:hypothetical protein PsorP6_006009 [Peronosclerospora sorghi]
MLACSATSKIIPDRTTNRTVHEHLGPDRTATIGRRDQTGPQTGPLGRNVGPDRTEFFVAHNHGLR